VASGGDDKGELLGGGDGFCLLFWGDGLESLVDLVAVEMYLVILGLYVLPDVIFGMLHIRHSNDGALRVVDDGLIGGIAFKELLKFGQLVQTGMAAQRLVARLCHQSVGDGRSEQRRPGDALGGRAPGAAQSLAHYGGEQRKFVGMAGSPEYQLSEICHAVAGLHSLFASVVQPLGQLGDGAGGLGDVQNDLGAVAPFGYLLGDDRGTDGADALGVIELEGVEGVALEVGLHRQHIIRCVAVFSPGDVHHHVEVQIFQGLFHVVGVRIGAHGTADAADGGADSVVMLREHLRRHGARWVGAQHGEGTGLAGAPDLGTVLVGEIAAGGPELRHDAAAGHQRHAADDGQRDYKVAV